MTEDGRGRRCASPERPLKNADPLPCQWPRITQWTMFGLLGKDLSASDEKWLPRGRPVRLIGSLASIVAFFPIATLLAIVTLWCLDLFTGTGQGLSWLGKWMGSEDVAIVAVMAFDFLLTFGLTRAIYMLIAFRLASIRGRCSECLYDLTGNVSGVCPECGTAMER